MKKGTNIKEPLSNVQKELLKLYSTNMNEDELIDLKRQLAKYFAEKSVKEADQIWDRKNLTNDDMDRWLNE